MTNEEAIKILDFERGYFCDFKGCQEQQAFTMAIKALEQQSKTGHWIRTTKEDAYDIAGVKTWGIECQCDICNFTTIVIEDFGYYNYCPNCGAKMESEEK